MWRPGFDYDAACSAWVDGAHRSLCVYSVVYRGTPERPGLVLGLDKGGCCHGLVFRVRPEKVTETLCYLRKRELVTNVYREQMRQVTILDSDGSPRKVRALCYVVDRRHSQYAGVLPLDRQVEIVRNSRGRAGANLDYVLNTAAHLRDASVTDNRLRRLLVRLGQRR
jgi:glutathione-specific gamma-glutamylcyclotransferase